MGISWPSLIVDETSMTSDGIFTVGRILKDVGKISFVILVSEGFARETNPQACYRRLSGSLLRLSVRYRRLSTNVRRFSVVCWFVLL